MVGFCFSFPCEHHALAGGRWASLTKGFANAGALGVDPVTKLTAAYESLVWGSCGFLFTCLVLLSTSLDLS